MAPEHQSTHNACAHHLTLLNTYHKIKMASVTLVMVYLSAGAATFATKLLLRTCVSLPKISKISAMAHANAPTQHFTMASTLCSKISRSNNRFSQPHTQCAYTKAQTLTNTQTLILVIDTHHKEDNYEQFCSKCCSTC